MCGESLEEDIDVFYSQEKISKMEVECLTLKDLTSPRKSFGAGARDEEPGERCQSDQKENMCLERRRSTPLKSPDASTALYLNRRGATAELTHITPIKHSSLSEPWTPTANLKMLISAASPDIRDREMKKVLFRPIENEKSEKSPETQTEEGEEHSQCDATEEDELEKKPSRKQKSLGLLCQKFLALYPDYPPVDNPIWISLDKVATSLGVERRRIYDIVNVLESLSIVGRMAKNSYTWYGRRKLGAMLKELQTRGRQHGYHLQMETRDSGSNREEDAEGDGGNAGGRKDKSLRIMSQKFVMLFLVSKTQTVTLDAAAKILIEESQDSSHSKYKTKVRRLYDIANVLTSLNLIKKVHVCEDRWRKPAFKWLGPIDFNNTSPVSSPVSSPAPELEMVQRITREDLSRVKLSRHASFSITPTCVTVQRLVNSAPSSPHREVSQNQPVDYSRKSAVCRLQFGSSTDSRSTAVAPQTPASHPQPTLQPIFTTSPPPPSPSSPSHCLAYLPSLSQPSVVMLYRAPDPTEQGPEHGSPKRETHEEGRKRKREGEEEEVGKKGVVKCCEVKAESLTKETVDTNKRDSSQPSHYLYVPNNAGLNGLNFFLSSGQSSTGLPLSQTSVPTLAVPYVLVPSSSIPHYPLITANAIHHHQGADSHPKMSFSVASPARFMVQRTGAYGLGTEVNRTHVNTPSTPEQSRAYGATPASTPCSVSGTSQEPMTPQTPEDNMASKSFFQTPATPVVSVAPTVRKRGSAQRRLDVGHPPNH